MMDLIVFHTFNILSNIFIESARPSPLIHITSNVNLEPIVYRSFRVGT